MKAKIETVSVDMASLWLGKMAANRSCRQAVVNCYLADMKKGNWHHQGDPIRFNVDGQLIDGQHRLRALILYGKPLEFLIVRGVPVEAMSTIDAGVKRSAADQFTILGHSHASMRAATLRLLMSYRLSGGQSIQKSIAELDSRGKKTLRRPPTTDELLAEMKHWPSLDESFKWAQPAKAMKGIGPSMFVALHYLFAQKDENAADEFMAGLLEGVNLPKSSPILALRKNLLNGLLKGVRFTTLEIGTRCIMAWNAYRERRQMSIIKVVKTKGGMNKRLPVLK